MDMKTYTENRTELNLLWEGYNNGRISSFEFNFRLSKIKENVVNEQEFNKLLLGNAKTKRDYKIIIPFCFKKRSKKETKLEREFLELVGIVSEHPGLRDGLTDSSVLEDYNREVKAHISVVSSLEEELFGFYLR